MEKPKKWTFRIRLEQPFIIWSFSLLQSLHCIAARLVQISTCAWVKYPYIEKCLLTSFRNALMSSLASFNRFVLKWGPHLDRGNNFDSISVFLQTCDTIFAVRLCQSLCLTLTKPVHSDAEYRIYFRMDKMLEDLWFPNHIVN